MRLNRIKPKSVDRISPKAFLVVSYDGKECIIPDSQLHFGQGHYWIPTWLAEKKEIQYAPTKVAYLKNGEVCQPIVKKVHTPEAITEKPIVDDSLIR